jgi:aldehyde dehydrogenase (NAD+)
MSTPDYTSLVEGQRAYFKAGSTRPMSWRIEQLKAVKAMIEASRDAMREAPWHDLRRNPTDADLKDVDINVHEAAFALAHLHEWICGAWREIP